MADMIATIRDALKKSLPEDVHPNDLERAAWEVADALRGKWQPITYQARVKQGVKLNMREEPSTKSRIDGQLFEHAVVSVINPDPVGSDEFVSVAYCAYASLKSLVKINDG